MNGFQRHNIDHLSASSINLWSNAPDVWVARYILKARMPFGPAPERGKAVESAVAAVLQGESETTAIKAALDSFDRRFFLGDEASTKERALIEPMVQVALEELIEFGRPEFTTDGGQEKIEINANFGDWSIPIWGFLDFVFPQHGMVVDLKTTTRVPSKMSADHVLQRAIYAKAKGNHSVKFLYVSDKKAAWLEDGETAEVLAAAKAQIKRMEAFLAHHTTDTAKACVPVSPASFYWRGSEGVRQEIYGL